MEQKKTSQPNAGAAVTPESTAADAPKKDFVEPDISEPVDILAATKFFLQVTGGGDT